MDIVPFVANGNISIQWHFYILKILIFWVTMKKKILFRRKLKRYKYCILFVILRQFLIIVRKLSLNSWNNPSHKVLTRQHFLSETAHDCNGRKNTSTEAKSCTFTQKIDKYHTSKFIQYVPCFIQNVKRRNYECWIQHDFF